MKIGKFNIELSDGGTFYRLEILSKYESIGLNLTQKNVDDLAKLFLQNSRLSVQIVKIITDSCNKIEELTNGN